MELQVTMLAIAAWRLFLLYPAVLSEETAQSNPLIPEAFVSTVNVELTFRSAPEVVGPFCGKTIPVDAVDRFVIDFSTPDLEVKAAMVRSSPQVKLTGAGIDPAAYYTWMVVNQKESYKIYGTVEKPLIQEMRVNILGGDISSGVVVTSYASVIPDGKGQGAATILLYKQEGQILDPSVVEYVRPACLLGLRCVFDVEKYRTDNNLTLVFAGSFVVKEDAYSLHALSLFDEHLACHRLWLLKVAENPLVGDAKLKVGIKARFETKEIVTEPLCARVFHYMEDDVYVAWNSSAPLKARKVRSLPQVHLRHMMEQMKEKEEGDDTEGGDEPGDGKAGDSKPGDGKAGDSKPGDGKPADSKPGDSKPADSKPADGKPADSKPEDSEPGKEGDEKSGGEEKKDLWFTLLLVDQSPIGENTEEKPFVNWVVTNIKNTQVNTGDCNVPYLPILVPTGIGLGTFLLFKQSEKVEIDPSEYTNATECDFQYRCNWDIARLVEEKKLELVGALPFHIEADPVSVIHWVERDVTTKQQGCQELAKFKDEGRMLGECLPKFDAWKVLKKELEDCVLEFKKKMIMERMANMCPELGSHFSGEMKKWVEKSMEEDKEHMKNKDDKKYGGDKEDKKDGGDKDDKKDGGDKDDKKDGGDKDDKKDGGDKDDKKDGGDKDDKKDGGDKDDKKDGGDKDDKKDGGDKDDKKDGGDKDDKKDGHDMMDMKKEEMEMFIKKFLMTAMHKIDSMKDGKEGDVMKPGDKMVGPHCVHVVMKYIAHIKQKMMNGDHKMEDDDEPNMEEGGKCLEAAKMFMKEMWEKHQAKKDEIKKKEEAKKEWEAWRNWGKQDKEQKDDTDKANWEKMMKEMWEKDAKKDQGSEMKKKNEMMEHFKEKMMKEFEAKMKEDGKKKDNWEDKWDSWKNWGKKEDKKDNGEDKWDSWKNWGKKEDKKDNGEDKWDSWENWGKKEDKKGEEEDKMKMMVNHLKMKIMKEFAEKMKDGEEKKDEKNDWEAKWESWNNWGKKEEDKDEEDNKLKKMVEHIKMTIFKELMEKMKDHKGEDKGMEEWGEKKDGEDEDKFKKMMGEIKMKVMKEIYEKLKEGKGSEDAVKQFKELKEMVVKKVMAEFWEKVKECKDSKEKSELMAEMKMKVMEVLKKKFMEHVKQKMMEKIKQKVMELLKMKVMEHAKQKIMEEFKENIMKHMKQKMMEEMKDKMSEEMKHKVMKEMKEKMMMSMYEKMMMEGKKKDEEKKDEEKDKWDKMMGEMWGKAKEGKEKDEDKWGKMMEDMGKKWGEDGGKDMSKEDQKEKKMAFLLHAFKAFLVKHMEMKEKLEMVQEYFKHKMAMEKRCPLSDESSGDKDSENKCMWMFKEMMMKKKFMEMLKDEAEGMKEKDKPDMNEEKHAFFKKMVAGMMDRMGDKYEGKKDEM